MRSPTLGTLVDVAVAAVAAVGFARGLPFVPAGPAVILVPWFLFFAAPAWLWRNGTEPNWARALHRGILHNLLVLGLLALIDPSLTTGRWLWAATLVGPILVPKGPSSSRRRPAWAQGGAVIAVALGLSVWMFVSRVEPSVWSDAPAHLAAVHDAARADGWIPPDSGADTAQTDPRFGIAHGLYASLAQVGESTPLQTLSLLPVLVTALWFLGHGRLFGVLGAPGWLAWVVAAIFTVGGAGGRGFGLWGSSYPGNLALALATFGLAEWIEGTFRGRYLRAFSGVAAVALTAWIHPFAWWGSTLGLGIGGLFLLVSASWRDAGRRIVVGSVGSAILGALVMLPRLLDRADSATGLHFQVTDALTINDSLFIADPFWLMRWGGATALAAFPLAVTLVSRWNQRTTLAFGFAAATYLISLNPLLHPLAWQLGSYLSVRLVRLTFTPLLLALAVIAAADLARRAHRAPGRLWGVAALVFALTLLGQDVRTAVLRAWNPPPREVAVWNQARPIARALATARSSRFAADPRTSYAVRALGAPPASILPVAHASPRDADLARRLRHFRTLFDARTSADSLRASLSVLNADHLVLNHAADIMYPTDDFGFVMDVSRSRGLEARLRAASVPMVQVSEHAVLIRVDDILRAPLVDGEVLVAQAPARQVGGGAGSRFRVLDVTCHPSSAQPGDEVSVDVWYTAEGDPGRAVAHPEWEQVTLRFEGPMRRAPEWAAPAGKLVRKILLERTGLSPARFHTGWVPFDGAWPAARWPDVVRESRSVRIPRWVVPGEYTIELSVQEAPWRTRLPLTDYLHDEDSLSGPNVGSLTVINAVGASEVGGGS